MPTGRIGPGPGAYALPSMVGFDKHDPARFRNPQYSMAAQLIKIDKRVSPGPKYAITDMTRHGKVSPPAYTLPPRNREISVFKPPGPGTYSPELAPLMKEPRPPAYTIAPRNPDMRRLNVPAPNHYPQPSTLGPKVPNMPANAAYTMCGIHDPKPQVKSPGPAQYGETLPQMYKNKAPNYTMGIKHFDYSFKQQNPGPAGYLPKMPRHGQGGYSFGQRTINEPYIIANDNAPCTRRSK